MTDRARGGLGGGQEDPLEPPIFLHPPAYLEPTDYLAQTLPLPAIDLAAFEASLPTSPVPAAAVRAAAVPASSGPASSVPTSAEPTGPPDRAGLDRVARGGALNLGGALVSAVASLGLTIVVTHNFSRPVAGAFFVAMSLFLIVEAVANLGAYNGAIYFIARLRTLRAERRIPAILRATIVPVVISSVVGTAAVVVFADPLARLLLDGKSAQGVSPADVASALRAMALALPFAALTDTLLGAARGYHEMRPTVVVDRIGRSGLQALGVLAAALAGSSALLAPAWGIPYVLASVVSIIWLRRIMRRKRRPPAKAGQNSLDSRPSSRQRVRNRTRAGRQPARQAECQGILAIHRAAITGQRRPDRHPAA